MPAETRREQAKRIHKHEKKDEICDLLKSRQSASPTRDASLHNSCGKSRNHHTTRFRCIIATCQSPARSKPRASSPPIELFNSSRLSISQRLSNTDLLTCRRVVSAQRQGRRGFSFRLLIFSRARAPMRFYFHASRICTARD